MLSEVASADFKSVVSLQLDRRESSYVNSKFARIQVLELSIILL